MPPSRGNPLRAGDNAVQLLNIVRGGIIRPPLAAGEFTPLLRWLLQLNPATRPDAATARDLLDDFAKRGNAPAPRRQSTPPPPERWWLRHRALSMAVALIILAAVGAGTALGLLFGGGSSEVGALPSTVGPIALTGDPKAADPCALIDLTSLRRFGQPSLTFSKELAGCKANIATRTGDVRIDVSFADPPVTATLRGTPQRLGDLTIVRKTERAKHYGANCENVLALADQTRISIRTYASPARLPYDLCSVTEVGTTTAVNRLARDGISYRPGRTSGSPIAGSDACTVLDHTALTKVAGLDATIRHPGFAHWSCTWGAYSNGSPQVSWSSCKPAPRSLHANTATQPSSRAGAHGCTRLLPPTTILHNAEPTSYTDPPHRPPLPPKSSKSPSPPPHQAPTCALAAAAEATLPASS